MITHLVVREEDNIDNSSCGEAVITEVTHRVRGAMIQICFCTLISCLSFLHTCMGGYAFDMRIRKLFIRTFCLVHCIVLGDIRSYQVTCPYLMYCKNIVNLISEL